MEGPTDDARSLRKGCRVYYRGWNKGFLYIAAFEERDHVHMARLVDIDGTTIFSQLPVNDLWHMGQDHMQCEGNNVKDTGHVGLDYKNWH